MQKTKNPKNIVELLKWKFDFKENITVEKYNKSNPKYENLDWFKTNDDIDVLYSVLSIYLFGLCAYDSDDKFKIYANMIKYDSGINAYSNKFIKNLYMDKKFEELNNNEYLNEFSRLYFSIGNVTPLWPGGNINKGKSFIFDLPELYFTKHEYWTDILVSKYENCIFLDELRNTTWFIDGDTKKIYDPPIFDFKSTSYFLKSLFQSSTDGRKWLFNCFIRRINYIIKNREQAINDYLNNQVNLNN